MATFYPMGGGGSPAFSSDTTAVDTNVISGKTAIISSSNDEAATGALDKKAVLHTYGGITYEGTLCINSTTAF